MSKVLEVNNITKSYGRLTAVDGLSFSVSKSSIYGILGPNGSGKTTTLGIVLDIIRPNNGKFLWFGEPFSAKVRKRIGAILETPNFYPYMTANDNLKIIADIKEVSFDEIDERLNMVGLYKRKSSRYRTFSLGMKQRLALAAVMLGEPEVLILDEPTNGLDPQGIAEVRQLIVKIASTGVTILLASHLLDEVEKVCTEVLVLRRGKKLFEGKVSQLSRGEVTIELGASDNDRLIKLLKSYKGIKSIQTTEKHIEVTFEGEVDEKALSTYLFNNGIAVSHFNLKKKSLETQFLELLKEK